MATNSISRTEADCRPVGKYLSVRKTTGGTVYAGEAVYIASDGDVERTDGDGSLSALALGIAVADNDGGTVFPTGTRVDIVTFGRVAGYSSMTPGLPVYCSTLPGQMQTADTFVTGDYRGVVGKAFSASEILVNPFMMNGFTAVS